MNKVIWAGAIVAAVSLLAVADTVTVAVTNDVGKVVTVKTEGGVSTFTSPAVSNAVAKVVEGAVPSWARSETPPATYDDAQAGVVATNVVREANGGIWDVQLEVWWTPRMENGCLTYYATTNVNQAVTE